MDKTIKYSTLKSERSVRLLSEENIINKVEKWTTTSVSTTTSTDSDGKTSTSTSVRTHMHTRLYYGESGYATLSCDFVAKEGDPVRLLWAYSGDSSYPVTLVDDATDKIYNFRDFDSLSGTLGLRGERLVSRSKAALICTAIVTGLAFLSSQIFNPASLIPVPANAQALGESLPIGIAVLGGIPCFVFWMMTLSEFVRVFFKRRSTMSRENFAQLRRDVDKTIHDFIYENEAEELPAPETVSVDYIPPEIKKSAIMTAITVALVVFVGLFFQLKHPPVQREGDSQQVKHTQTAEEKEQEQEKKKELEAAQQEKQRATEAALREEKAAAEIIAKDPSLTAFTEKEAKVIDDLPYLSGAQKAELKSKFKVINGTISKNFWQWYKHSVAQDYYGKLSYAHYIQIVEKLGIKGVTESEGDAIALKKKRITVQQIDDLPYLSAAEKTKIKGIIETRPQKKLQPLYDYNGMWTVIDFATATPLGAKKIEEIMTKLDFVPIVTEMRDVH